MTDHAALIQVLTSGAFALTFTAVLRKFWPVIDGKWVLLVVLLLSSAASFVTTYATMLPQWAWAIITSIVGAITFCGGTEWADRLALKNKTDAK